MNTSIVNKLILEFNTYIAENGGLSNSWYVGVSDNLYRRLYQEHHVSRSIPHLFNAQPIKDAEARAVERHFINQLGLESGFVRDTHVSYVYIYKKGSFTDP